MLEPLKKNPKFKGRKGPLVLVIMDGVGYGKYKEGDAVRDSHLENLCELTTDWPTTKLKAHGKAVGMPSDADMGNSEVGHNAMGCGRIFEQGASLVSHSIQSGAIFKGATWLKLIDNVKKNNSTLHFIGLLSDGNVHSHIDHLKAMILEAKKEGVKRVRVHALLDGRDVGETSALDYFDPFAAFLKDLSTDGFDARIASGGGRQAITMDRYNANWDLVRKGWEIHVLGEGRQFDNAHDAIVTLREETHAIDQDIPGFVIAENGKPIGPILDNDSVIFFNFRGDRAMEMTKAFEDKDFTKFDRKRYPKVEYAGMMEYDGDLHIPKQFLVAPPSIDRTMGEYLAATGVTSFAISEDQKFGHVTYFFNGNRTEKFDEKLETYVRVPSDKVPFEQRPAMQAAPITDETIKAIDSGKYAFIRLNYPNGDMVGHTGVYEAVVCSLEAMDLALGRLRDDVAKAGGVMVVTADHGNSDDMYEHDKEGKLLYKSPGVPKPKTSHSLNPVPCIIFDPDYKGEYKKELRTGLGITSITATCIELLGYLPPSDYDPSVLQWN